MDEDKWDFTLSLNIGEEGIVRDWIGDEKQAKKTAEGWILTCNAGLNHSKLEIK